MTTVFHWSEFWDSYNNQKAPCCKPNAGGACNSKCPRIHPEHADRALFDLYHARQAKEEYRQLLNEAQNKLRAIRNVLYPFGPNTEWNSETLDNVDRALEGRKP